MARNTFIRSGFGEIAMGAVPAEAVCVPLYTVPAGGELRITDIKIMAGMIAGVSTFWINLIGTGHVFALMLGGAGVLHQTFRTPLPFTAGQSFTITALGPALTNMRAEWTGKLFQP